MVYGGVVMMYMFVILVFIGLLFYYVDEVCWVMDMIISDFTVIVGYDCASLSSDEFYGLNYMYEECLMKIVLLIESVIGFDIVNVEVIVVGGYLIRIDYSNGGIIFYNCLVKNSVYYNLFGSV